MAPGCPSDGCPLWVPPEDRKSGLAHFQIPGLCVASGELSQLIPSNLLRRTKFRRLRAPPTATFRVVPRSLTLSSLHPTSPPRTGKTAVTALTVGHFPSEVGGPAGSLVLGPILLSGHKMLPCNQESETAHSLDSWEHQKAHGHRPLEGVGSPTCTRLRERQVKTAPDGKSEEALGRGQIGATPPPGGRPWLAAITRRSWAMLVPSTTRPCTRSSERPRGEWRAPMPQGQQPAWGWKHDRLQS